MCYPIIYLDNKRNHQIPKFLCARHYVTLDPGDSSVRRQRGSGSGRFLEITLGWGSGTHWPSLPHSQVNASVHTRVRACVRFENLSVIPLKVTHIDVRYLMSSFSASSSQVRPLCSFQSPWHFLQVSWGWSRDTDSSRWADAMHVPGRQQGTGSALHLEFFQHVLSLSAGIFLKNISQQKRKSHEKKAWENIPCWDQRMYCSHHPMCKSFRRCHEPPDKKNYMRQIYVILGS